VSVEHAPFVLRGGLCMDPGTSYSVRLRGLDVNREPVTEWFAGKFFTVSHSGCVDAHGWAGMCATKALCEHYDGNVALPNARGCDTSTDEIVCCAPKPVVSAITPRPAAQPFRFVTPAKRDSMYVRYGSAMTVTWSFDATEIDAERDMQLLAIGHQHYVTLATVPVSALNTTLVFSAGADGVPMRGRYAVVARYVDSYDNLDHAIDVHVMPTPCIIDHSTDVTLFGLCTERSTCTEQVDEAACDGIGGGSTVCCYKQRVSSRGFKDSTNNLDNDATHNVVSLLVLMLVALLLTL